MKKITGILLFALVALIASIRIWACGSTDCGGTGQAYSDCNPSAGNFMSHVALTSTAATMNIGQTVTITANFQRVGSGSDRLACVYIKDATIDSNNYPADFWGQDLPASSVGSLGQLVPSSTWDSYFTPLYILGTFLYYQGSQTFNFTPTQAGTYTIYMIERSPAGGPPWTIVPDTNDINTSITITVNDNWTAFDEAGAWQDYGAWSPSPGWYWENQTPTTTTQTCTKRRWHKTGERNSVGTERNVGGYWENGSDSQVVANSSRPNPSISVQILDGSKNVIGLNGSGRAPVPCNSYFYIRVNGSDPWGSLQTLYSRLNDANGNGVDYPAVGVSGANASYDFGPYYTGNVAGVWDMWAHVCSSGESGYQWWGNGWSGTQAPDIEVYNRAPTASLSVNRSSANIGDSVTITLTANDPDGNLDYTNLWVATPGYGWRWIHADNSVVTGGALDRNHTATPIGSQGTFTRSFTFTLDQGFGNYTFQLTAVDVLGASVTPAQQVVTVSDRYPTVTMSASPNPIYFGQTTTVTATASDEDGNLYFSGIMALNQARDTWQRSAATDYSDSWWGNYPTSTNFIGANHSTGRISGAYASKNVTYKPSWAGYVTFHTNAHDPYNWASARPDWCAVASNYGYVDVTVLKATPVINGVNNQTFTGTHTVVASDITANSTNPYDGSVAQASLPFYVWNGSSWEGFSVGRVFMPGTYRILADSSANTNYEYASKEVQWTVVNRPPQCSPVSGPTSVTVGQSATYTFSVTDPDGDMTGMETYFADPTLGFGVSGNWWPNRVDYPASGGNYTTNRSFTFNQVGNWQAAYRVSDTSGWYTYWVIGSSNWSSVLNITVNKATPAVNFSSPGVVYVNQSANLSASVSGGYNPTGGISYSIVGTSGGANGSISGSVLTVSNLGNSDPGYITVRATYAGDANNNAASTDVVVTVPNRAPSGLFTIDGAGANKTVTVGQTVLIASTLSDPDGNMATHSIWWDLGNGTYWANPWVAWSVPVNSTGWSELSSTGNGYNVTNTWTDTLTGKFTPWATGTYTFHSAGGDGPTWVGIGPASVLYLTVQKASPSITFPALSPLYVGQSATLGASVTGGYSPTGSISYSVVSSTGGASASISGNTITVNGLVSGNPGTLTVRATYSGDGNNNGTTADITISVPDRQPTNISMTATNVVVGQSTTITARSSDPDGNLTVHHYVFSGPQFTGANNWEGTCPTNGLLWHHLTSVPAGNGSDATTSTTYAMTVPGTYYLTLNSEDAVPSWTYNASNVMASFTVSKATPSVSFPAVADTYVGQVVNLTASTSGGYSPTGTITYAIVATTGGATGSISGSTLTVTGLSSGNPGTITVRATYPGDSNNNSVTVDRTLNVPNRLPTITLSASANSIVAGQAITFTVTGNDPDGNLTWLNLDIPSPGGYFQVNAGPYTFDGTSVPNNGLMSFAQTSTKSQSCTITFTNPGVYVFTGCGGDPLGRGDSAPMTVTVSPRLTSASITDQSGRLSAVATTSTSIEFGQSVTFSVTSSNLSSVTVAENGTPIQTASVTGSPMSVTATPQNGGNRTITIYPTSGGGVQGTVVVNQYGATAIRITQPDGTVRTEPAAGPILVYQIGNYSIQAVWSSGSNTTISSAIVATLADPGTPLATISVGVRPRIDSFGVVGTLPEVNPTTPTLKVTPTVPVLPGDDFVIPSSVDIAWTNSTGSITGPGITAQNSVNGSTSLTLTNTLLTGDGTVTYTMAGRVKTYYAQWASTAGSSAELQFSSDNVSFAAYSAMPTSGTTGILPVGYYRMRVSNAAGFTSSAAVYCTGNVTEPAISASIQPKVPLAVLTANPLMGSAYPSKNYTYNTVADVVTAVANTGFQVTNFTGDTYGASSIAANVQGATTGSVTGLVMTAPRVVTAHFDYLTYQVTKSVNRNGTVADNGSVSLSGLSHTDYFGTTGYRYNSTVTATYTPEVTAFGNPKYELTGWTDNGVPAPAASQYSVSLFGSAASSHLIIALESLRRFPLIVNPVVDGDGSPRVWNRDGTYTDVPVTTTISTSPSSGPFEIDTDVGLSATMPTAGANPVIRGITWAGGGVSTTMNPLAANVFMSGPRTVTVTLHTKLAQTCAWVPPGTVTVGDIVDVNAITSAGYSCEVTFDAGGANVSYNAATKQMVVNSAGVIVLRLWHPGDGTYLPAEPVVYTLMANAALKIKVTPSVRSTSNKEGDVEDNSTQQVITR